MAAKFSQEFKCLICERVDEYEPYAEPEHCHARMAPGEILFRGGEDGGESIGTIEIPRDKLAALDALGALAVTEVDPSWNPALEVWFMKPGRQGGERIGWTGRGRISWGWKMVSGVKMSSGHAGSRNEALDAMLTALMGDA